MKEKDLITKLATKWHLNVQERDTLPNGKAKASLFINSIEELLKQHGSYPIDWDINEDFDGGLLKLNSSKQCLLYWKNEVGVMRFESQKTLEFSSTTEAVKTYVIRLFKDNIDGIVIDWNS